MNRILGDWYHTWQLELRNNKYLIGLSIIFFIIANIVSLLASSYVDKLNSVAAQDLILDHIPSLDLDFMFGYGLIAVILVIIVYILFFRIREFHRVTIQFSLLILMRSFFIVLTHLGKPADAHSLSDLPGIYQIFNFHNDLFFSGHTAIPFMAFLLFRKDRIALFFLIMTFVLAATVLFLHVHYSIDVFSAFFITYGTFKIGELISRKVSSW
jgi:hypothetical protein